MSVSRTFAASALLCMAFVSTVAAGPREVRQAGANGDGGGTCPDVVDATTASDTHPPAAKRTPASKAKSAPMLRGGDDSAARSPRWHSFLPGMFR